MKLKSLLYSKKLSVGLIGFLICGMISWAGYSHLRESNPSHHGNLHHNPKPIKWKTSGPIKVKSGLSQYKLMQNQNGEFYMQVDIEAEDNLELKASRKPTDYVVVLDRSGSMSGDNKINYAHEAIQSLIKQLGDKDQLGLIAFDSNIETPIPLQKISKKDQSIWFSKIDQLIPRGGTHLSGGLEAGIKMLKLSESNHAKRIILLSDGEANEGITSLPDLNAIARKASDHDIVISTIGLGLDFNENLMANLADHGRGNYHYLEKLNSLEKVLAQEFYSASQILAKNLNLYLKLNPSIKIKDASGYPIEKVDQVYHINAGHLYYGQHKSFFVTFNLPTQILKTYEFGTGGLSFETNGQTQEVKLDKNNWKVSILPQERRGDIVASIDKKIFSESWIGNNFGSLMRENSKLIKEGRRDEAKKLISSYKSKLNYANSLAKSPDLENQLNDLDAMEEQIDDAFTGPNQSQKRKGLSKDYQKESYNKQRKVN